MPSRPILDLSPEQIVIAEGMRYREGQKPRDLRSIAKEMGVSEYALLKHFKPEMYERRRARQKAFRVNVREAKAKGISIVPCGRPLDIPDHVLARQERRLCALPVSLTAALMGDPLPGESALDRVHRETI